MIVSGKLNKFIASQNLEVYVYIKKKDQMYYKVELNNSYKLFKLSEELDIFITPKERIRLISLDENNYKKEIPDYITISETFGDFHNKAIIPKGTTYYISDDLNYIIPELLYITDQKIDKDDSRETDLSELYKFGADVYTKEHKRFKVTSGEYNKKDVIGIFVGKDKVMSTEIDTVIYENEILDIKSKKFYDNKPEKDNKGYENTQILKKYNKNLENICKDNLYIPSIGELLKVYKNIFKINLTLEYLGKDTIKLNKELSFLSSTLRTYSTFWKFTIRNGEINIEEEDFYTYQSTFLFYRTE